MATEYKIAAKIRTTELSDTQFYVVPANKSFISTMLNVSNGEETDDIVYSVGVIKNGETSADIVYLVQNKTLSVGEIDSLKLGLTLATGDAIYIKTNGKTTNFVLFGAEIS